MKRVVPALLAALLAGVYGNAAALTVTLDNFSVTKNGNTAFFNDDFADDDPPPSSPSVFPSGPAVYSYVRGSMTESGGKLSVDNTGAGGTNALGQPRDTGRATLQTNTSTAPDAVNSGLKSGHTFSMTGLFDLNLALTGGDGYGIRFVDRDAGGFVDNANDFVQLGIQQTVAGTFIRFYEQDFIAQTITTLAEIDLASILPNGADQIAFILSRDNLDNKDIIAGFEFYDDGMLIGSGGFEEVGSIFDGENFTRAEFYVTSNPNEVPEPGAAAMLLAALGGLAMVRRRRA